MAKKKVSDAYESSEEFQLPQQEVSNEQVSALVPVNTMRSSSKLLVAILSLLVIALLIGFGLAVKDRSNLKKEVSELSQSQVAADEAKQLSMEIGAVIELPADETPTVATVVDASKVKTQAFFANAQNGDKILLYSKNSKAILYRPSTKKIIEVAPINIGPGQSTTVPKQ